MKDKELQRISFAKWYKNHGRKRTEKDFDSVEKWRIKNKEKISAEHKLAYKVRTGKIKRPFICSICGLEKRIYAHHPDYTKPYNILWLCGSCHKRIHTGDLIVYVRV